MVIVLIGNQRVEIPEHVLEGLEQVLEGLEQVRSSGVINMMDYRGVLRYLLRNGHPEAIDWLDRYSAHYVDILNAFGEWSSERAKRDEDWTRNEENDLIGDQDPIGDNTPDRDDDNPGDF